MENHKLLNFILVEGIFVTLLGMGMIILPKISSLAVAMILSVAIMLFGLYRIGNAILMRKYIEHLPMSIFMGIVWFLTGLALSVFPLFNLIVLTVLMAFIFMVESINTSAFTFQMKDILKWWWLNLIVAFMQFTLAMIILIGLPATALWVVGLMVGINFLFSGMSLISLFIATRYSRDNKAFS